MIDATQPSLPIITADQAHGARDRLIGVASGDSGGAVAARLFLMAWWDGAFGSFEITQLFRMDREIAKDVVVILAFLVQNGFMEPHAWGDREVFERWAERRA